MQNDRGAALCGPEPRNDQEYFCCGIADDLITALTQLAGLLVVSRTSAFQFRSKAHDVRAIGRKLNAGMVLEGSVQKVGKRVRVTAQLTSVADGYHLWSERYDREMKDVFAIQDEISKAIVKKLRVNLVGRQNAAPIKRHAENRGAPLGVVFGLRRESAQAENMWLGYGWKLLLRASHINERLGAAVPHYHPQRAGATCA